MSEPVKVRIALAIDCKGEWCASGYSGMDGDEGFGNVIDTLEPGEARYWIEATVYKPEGMATVVQGTATKAEVQDAAGQ